METQKRILPSRQAKNLKVSYKSLAGCDRDSDSSEPSVLSDKNDDIVEIRYPSSSSAKTESNYASKSKLKSAKAEIVPKQKSNQIQPPKARGRPPKIIETKEPVVKALKGEIKSRKQAELIVQKKVTDDDDEAKTQVERRKANRGGRSTKIAGKKKDPTEESDGSSSGSNYSESDSEESSGSNNFSDISEDSESETEVDKIRKNKSKSEKSNNDEIGVDVIIKEEQDYEDTFQDDNEPSMLMQNVIAKQNQGAKDDGEDEHAINHIPFKIINVEKETSAAGIQSATWITSMFTIKAILPETVSDKKLAPRRPPNPDFPRKNTRTFAPDRPKVITCPVCKIDIIRHKLNLHMLSEHRDISKPFSCEICDTKWKSYQALKKHLIRHTDEQPYKCDVCQTLFKRDYTLKHHQYNCHTAEGIARYGEFRRKVNASQRKKPRPIITDVQKEKGYRIGRNGYKIMPGMLPPYKCPDCTDEYDTPYQLQRHHAYAHQERPFLCPQCGNTYTSQNQLHNHILAHGNIRSFVCHQCGATYKNNSHLRSHIRRYHDPVGHEQYKAYRRMVQRKQRMRLNQIKEAEGRGKKKKSPSVNSAT